MTDAEKSPVDETLADAAAEDKKEDSSKIASSKSNAIWMGTAVGIGSAALVAALMYARRRK
jgi:hypothetical protein